jgi:hypothetical protein
MPVDGRVKGVAMEYSHEDSTTVRPLLKSVRSYPELLRWINTRRDSYNIPWVFECPADIRVLLGTEETL